VHWEAIKIFVALQVFSHLLQGQLVTIWCDSRVAVSVLQAGRGQDPILHAIAINIWLWLSSIDCEVEFRHIPGKLNQVADLLSRLSSSRRPLATLFSLLNQVPVWLPVPPMPWTSTTLFNFHHLCYFAYRYTCVSGFSPDRPLPVFSLLCYFLYFQTSHHSCCLICLLSRGAWLLLTGPLLKGPSAWRALPLHSFASIIVCLFLSFLSLLFWPLLSFLLLTHYRSLLLKTTFHLLNPASIWRPYLSLSPFIVKRRNNTLQFFYFNFTRGVIYTNMLYLTCTTYIYIYIMLYLINNINKYYHKLFALFLSPRSLKRMFPCFKFRDSKDPFIWI
jgi:hypothetical protein